MDLDKLVSFHGRMGRGPYWLTSLGALVLYVVGFVLVEQAGTVGLLIGFPLFLVAFVISLATQTKRWHDRNKSGWWWLISFVPLIGGLWAFIETGLLGGTPGENRYGSPSSGSPFAG